MILRQQRCVVPLAHTTKGMNRAHRDDLNPLLSDKVLTLNMASALGLSTHSLEMNFRCDRFPAGRCVEVILSEF